ncbi:MAG: hypothetical protein KF852_11660 [Saprospiraceae bacterium]|nr:hypothetical protein [Saprospiraceae bacterium]
MEQIIITLKDSSKRSFLMELLKRLDFIELQVNVGGGKKTDYDFFQSAGLMEGREINAEELRKQAWRVPQ